MAAGAASTTLLVPSAFMWENGAATMKRSPWGAFPPAPRGRTAPRGPAWESGTPFGRPPEPAGSRPHRVAPAETAREQAARAGLGQLVDLAVRVFTGTLPVEAIDQRGGAGRSRPIDQVAQVDRLGHLDCGIYTLAREQGLEVRPEVVH